MKARLIVSILMALAMAGCGLRQGDGRQLTAGIYRPLPEETAKVVAADAVSALVRRFPPALTRIGFVQAGEGAVGAEIDAALRRAGFAVDPNLAEAAVDRPALRIAVDNVDPTVFRLTLVVWAGAGAGYTIFSRGYSERGAAVYPVGNWTLREPDGNG